MTRSGGLAGTAPPAGAFSAKSEQGDQQKNITVSSTATNERLRLRGACGSRARGSLVGAVQSPRVTPLRDASKPREVSNPPTIASARAPAVLMSPLVLGLVVIAVCVVGAMGSRSGSSARSAGAPASPSAAPPRAPCK